MARRGSQYHFARPEWDDMLHKAPYFNRWESILRGALDSRKCAGNIFHNFGDYWFKPVHPPTLQDNESFEEFAAKQAEFLENDLEAITIINLYLPEKWALRPNEKTTAKKSYEKLIAPYKRERATELQDVAREFSNVRLRHGDSVQYCMEFWAAYYKLQDVTEMFCEVKNVFFLECVPYYDYNRWIPLARYVESGECLFPGEYVVPKECT